MSIILRGLFTPLPKEDALRFFKAEGKLWSYIYANVGLYPYDSEEGKRVTKCLTRVYQIRACIEKTLEERAY
jgi:hypothetical protein